MIAPDQIRSLPVELAARLVLDSISYSNPLPPWSDSIGQNLAYEEATIRERIRKYLDGQAPERPFTIAVPKKGGEKKVWRLPSVTDQIIIQACVSSVAENVYRVVDSRHVWSYRYNTNPNRIQLTESQVGLWKQFQDETDRRCKVRTDCLLQIDLENAFESINREKFYTFLDELAPKHLGVSLLRHMLDSLMADGTGLPLINDSVFFLANAYLNTIDQIVSKHTDNFIRFVDDYRIFGATADELESILTSIDHDLSTIGFKLNKRKTKLGSAEEYLEAISNGKYAETTVVSGYVSAVVLGDVTAPDLLLKLIERAVESPNDFLTEGFGRLSLASIRRIRLNHTVAAVENYPLSPFQEYANRLSQDKDLVSRTVKLLSVYAVTFDEEWRAAWLINFLEDVYAGSVRELDDLLRFLTGSDNELLRLFARKAIAERSILARASPLNTEDLHYLDWGRRLWGQQ